MLWDFWYTLCIHTAEYLYVDKMWGNSGDVMLFGESNLHKECIIGEGLCLKYSKNLRFSRTYADITTIEKIISTRLS